ncbi:MAG: hypothetical protein UX30_C0016G0006 [Candidatus Saccharibacteria bacterium GW2011_GWA2_46_10]|nr:MAG: hypothetical protein UX30_C0016G0006 [Candidatus Saccharibacteria bacterium GW2011_GWA2_46_10]
MGTVVIRSTGHRNKVEMYANIPSKAEDGNKAINELANKKGISFQYLIQRGHSFNLDEALEEFSTHAREARILHAGSCGGQGLIPDIAPKFKKAPYLFATKGEGKMGINDPILYEMNKRILEGEDIDLPKLWSELEARFTKSGDKKLIKAFQQYILPYKNTALLFTLAYQDAAR